MAAGNETYRDRLFSFIFGNEEHKEWTLSLSDAFSPQQRDEADIEVTVRMVNINRGHSAALLEACRPLEEYAWIVDSIRALRPTAGLEAAIDQTIDRMPGDYIMKPFLGEHKAEVKNMLLTEYNEAETMELFKKEWLAEGRAEGRVEGQDGERVNSIRNLMDSLKLSARQAMELLKIPLAEQGKYESML